MFNDLTAVTLNTALDGLAMRQRAIADNIANINTPGFLARRVLFEGSLGAAAAGRNISQAEIVTKYSLQPTRMDGNNVNLDQETLANVETGLKYSLMLRAVDDRFKMLSTAMRSS